MLQQANMPIKTVFSITLTQSPMSSNAYWQARDFQTTCPDWVGDILVEKENFTCFSKIVSCSSHSSLACKKALNHS